MNVAYITSAGTVYGRLNTDSNFIPRCLNIQFIRLLFVLSMASWNIAITVSGTLETNASYKTSSSECKDFLSFKFLRVGKLLSTEGLNFFENFLNVLNCRQKLYFCILNDLLCNLFFGSATYIPNVSQRLPLC